MSFGHNLDDPSIFVLYLRYCMLASNARHLYMRWHVINTYYHLPGCIDTTNVFTKMIGLWSQGSRFNWLASRGVSLVSKIYSSTLINRTSVCQDTSEVSSYFLVEVWPFNYFLLISKNSNLISMNLLHDLPFHLSLASLIFTFIQKNFAYLILHKKYIFCCINKIKWPLKRPLLIKNQGCLTKQC